MVRIISERRIYRSDEEAHNLHSRHRRIRRVALSAAAVCLAAILLTGPIRTRYFTEAGLEINTGDTFKSPDTGSLAMEAGSFSPVLDEIPVPVTYHVIVGSFKDFGNARGLRNTMVGKGYQVRILAAGIDYYRVSASQTQDKAEANQILQSIRSQGYESAWLLTN